MTDGEDVTAARAPLAGQTLSQAAKPTPELGRLKSAAERIAFQANRLDSFIGRFHGDSTRSNGSDDCDKPVDSYRNDLSTLFAQIERLEALVSSLDSIG